MQRSEDVKAIVQMVKHNIFIAEKTLENLEKDENHDLIWNYVNGRKEAMEELKDFIDRLPKGAA